MRSQIRIALVSVIFAAFAVWTPTARAVTTLNANFDSASLCLVASSACDDAGVASTVSGNTVTLVGRDNFNNNEWKWIYFQASGVNGQTVTFNIGDDFDTGGASLNNHRMVYSYDQTNWSFFDNNARIAAQSKFTFSNNSPFTQDTVYVAYGQPYPYQRTVDHTNSIATTPWVTPTASGASTLVVAQSPGGVDDIGRTVTPKNLYGYKITDAAYSGPKRKVVVMSGVHANETLGNYTLEGLVNFLVSDELAAAQLRRYAEFYVYPMANPDGRFAGYNRSTVQIPTVDPNRAWNPPNYTDPDNPSPQLTDIRRLGEAIKVDTGQNIDYLIDFHSTVNPSTPYHHGLILPEWQSDPFWLAVKNLEPALITGSAVLSDFTGAKFGRDVLNAEFSATFETVFPVNEMVPRYLSLGRNFGLAWRNVFNLPADLNFDSALNAQDWLLFIAGAETNMTGFTAIQRYEKGDLDGDGKNSIEDFVLFRQLYDQANGAGAFATMLANVPEPCTTTLLILTALNGSLSIVRRPARNRHSLKD
jgi:hypothetical protein